MLVAFLSQDSDTARTSGLEECAKAVGKTNLVMRDVNVLQATFGEYLIQYRLDEVVYSTSSLAH
jgi:hypothetical protein